MIATGTDEAREGLLQLAWREGRWWLANVSPRLSATVLEDEAMSSAVLPPGHIVGIASGRTVVLVGAGEGGQEIVLEVPAPPGAAQPVVAGAAGALTLTLMQRQLIVALAEPALRASGSVVAVPGSRQAAARLGWSISKFNRKLDNVCEKLGRAGVRGLHGGAGILASNRRARLVEYALSSSLVSAGDLALLLPAGREVS